MMRKSYIMRKTISVRQFIEELGQSFSEHVKARLLELGERCILTRKEHRYVLDLRHVEHLKYDYQCDIEGSEGICRKEYTYGQLIVYDGSLYFSEACIENKDVMKNCIVNEIYSALGQEESLQELEIKAKKLDDSNIDFVIDSILKVCPEESAEHKAIIAKYSKLENHHGKTLSR